MDKQAKFKLIGLMSLIFIVFSLIIYATDYSNRLPDDGAYDLDGTDLVVNITVTPTSGNNISNISLWTNIGTWSRNQTINYTGGQDTSRVVGFVINALPNASIADGTDVIWSIEVGLNASNSTYGISFSTNRTINVEYPALVRLNLPVNNSWTSALQNLFNFTVNSSFTSSTLFPCSFWTNESGTWAQALGSLTATNSTQKAFNYQPGEGSIVWGIKCQQGDDGNVVNTSINFTLKIDRTSPVVTITKINDTIISNNTFLNTLTPIINYSITELNRDTCILFVNGSANMTSTAISNNFTFTAFNDGVYNFLIGCNDSANNWKNSSTYQTTLDTLPPQLIEPHNVSTGGFADRRSINFSSNELVNATIFYGTTVDTTSSVSNSSFSISKNITISGFEQNTQYYFNITICDRAGNCNKSGEAFGQFNFVFPFKLLTGWSYYGIYDSLINFSTILSQTNSEYVYYWNQTGQSWVSATAGGTDSMGFTVGTSATGSVPEGIGRHVVTIFESTNSTWERNVTAGLAYSYNLTTGDNFLKMYDSRTMGQLGRAFLNTTSLSGDILYGMGPLIKIANATGSSTDFTYNMSQFFFSAYNNSATDWEINYVYNSSLNNNTPLIGNYTIHEVVWVFSKLNLTYNGSNIVTNWTK